MVMGTLKSATIWTNAGSFSMPSSMVTNTTLSVSGTRENTVGSAALSVSGLTAGGGGAAANGFRPRYCCLIRSASTVVVLTVVAWAPGGGTQARDARVLGGCSPA